MSAPLTGQYAPLALRLDPALIMSCAGFEPDPWQSELIRDTTNWWLLLCTRQGGKTGAISALALATALNTKGALVLILTPSERQSKEVLRVVSDYYLALYGVPFKADAITALKVELPNRSRIVALPGSSEKTVRGYAGVDLIIVDEAARVDTELFDSVIPMLAVSRGRMVCASTPWARRGFFYHAWQDGGDRWKRITITADDCPRIDREFLAEQKKRMMPYWFMQEFYCAWGSAAGALFDPEMCDALLDKGIVPYTTNRLRWI